MLVSAVPLYDSLGESAVEYTVNHSHTSIIFAEASKLVFLAKAAKNVKENVKTVVFWGSADAAKDAAASIEKEVSVCPWILENPQREFMGYIYCGNYRLPKNGQ